MGELRRTARWLLLAGWRPATSLRVATL